MGLLCLHFICCPVKETPTCISIWVLSVWLIEMIPTPVKHVPNLTPSLNVSALLLWSLMTENYINLASSLASTCKITLMTNVGQFRIVWQKPTGPNMTGDHSVLCVVQHPLIDWYHLHCFLKVGGCFQQMHSRYQLWLDLSRSTSKPSLCLWS